jgi:serine/threonine-protein kinase
MRAPVSGDAPARGTIVMGKYQLERMIARGGMGAVWEAWDTALERRVAIKFMDPDIASRPALRARFNKEAKAAARVRTPHVVQIIEHGIDGSTPFIVMELLEGEDLQRRLKREKRLGLSDLVPVVRQIAKGLRAAHDAGIIHRDLKPQNVFLAQQDGELCVKILDFGVAKVRDLQVANDEHTKTGVVVGSPHYMSPEQARGLAGFDHRSDVWSLGVICFKALTGHRPFKGDVPGDVIVKICAEPIPKASESGRGIPRLMDRFFERALDRDPDRRFQSALELADAFEDYADEIIDDQMKTERWLLPPGVREGDATTALVTPATAVAVPQELPTKPTRLPSKPGVVVPPDADAPPPPVSMPPGATTLPEMRSPSPSDSGVEEGGSPNIDVHTPATGHSLHTGPSVSGFAGSVKHEAADLELPTMPIPLSANRVAMITGVAAAALLLLAVVAMALSTAPRVKSELSATVEAAAPAAQRMRPPERANAAQPSAPKEEPTHFEPNPPRKHVPVTSKFADPKTSTSASASARPEAAPPPEPPPAVHPPPRPRPHPKPDGNDWGY